MIYDTIEDSINDSENQTTGQPYVLGITSRIVSRKYSDNIRFDFVLLLVTGLYINAIS